MQAIPEGGGVGSAEQESAAKREELKRRMLKTTKFARRVAKATAASRDPATTPTSPHPGTAWTNRSPTSRSPDRGQTNTMNGLPQSERQERSPKKSAEALSPGSPGSPGQDPGREGTPTRSDGASDFSVAGIADPGNGSGDVTTGLRNRGGVGRGGMDAVKVHQ